MKEYILYVCDDEGYRIYDKKVKAPSITNARAIAWRWAMQVESEEGWFTTFEVEAA